MAVDHPGQQRLSRQVHDAYDLAGRGIGRGDHRRNAVAVDDDRAVAEQLAGTYVEQEVGPQDRGRAHPV